MSNGLTSECLEFSALGNMGPVEPSTFSLSALAAKGWLPLPPTKPRLSPLEIPPPPRIDPTSTDEQRITTLRNAYNCVIKHRKLRGYLRNDPKYTDLLTDASGELLERRIAPIAWVAWNCDVWNKSRSGTAKAPPISWTFSLTRINERRGWFKSEYGESRLSKVCVIYGDEYKDICRRWQSYQLKLWQEKPETEAQVAAITKECFPLGYAVHLAKAQQEAVSMQNDLDLQLQQGLWVWQ